VVFVIANATLVSKLGAHGIYSTITPSDWAAAPVEFAWCWSKKLVLWVKKCDL